MGREIGLTDAKVAGLKSPPGKQLEVADRILPGLRVRVGSGGAKSFILRTRIDGRQVNITLGRYPALSLANARKQARDVLLDRDEGRDPAARIAHRRRSGGAGRTFADWWETWLSRMVREKMRSAPEVERLGRNYILPLFGKRPVDKITRADVSRLVEAIAYGDPDRQRPRAAAIVRQTIASFYNWALPLLDNMPANPARDALRTPPSKPRERVLSEPEIRALWHACDACGWPFGSGFQLLLLTGQRRGEVFGASWAEFDGRQWTIPAERAKNGRAHMVPLPKAAVKILSALPRIGGTDLLFPALQQAKAAEDRPRRPVSGFSRVAARIDRKMQEEMARLADPGADVPEIAPWVIHDLRRTAATGMQRIGIRLEVVEAVLNHVSGTRAGLVGVYQRHDFAEEKADALESWAAEVARIVAGRQSGRGR